MKISIWNLFVFIAIVALGLGFALHLYVVEQRIAMFQQETCDELANIAFHARLDAARENFRSAGIEFQLTDFEFQQETDTGTYIGKYRWKQNQPTKLTGDEIYELTWPLTRHLGNEASPWIRWNVEVEPKLYGDQNVPIEGEVEFKIVYRISIAPI